MIQSNGTFRQATTIYLRLFSCLSIGFFTLFLSGCYSTDTDGPAAFQAGTMQRPSTVWVHSFAATPEEMHQESAMAMHVSPHETPQTVEQIREGRALSNEIAGELLVEIQKMGLTPRLGTPQSMPEVGDLIVVGALVAFDEGSATKRLAIGFGAGKSSMSAVSETFVVTPTGLLEIDSGTIDSGSKKTPGVALGLAGFIATSNPAGLIIGSATKIYGEASGSSTVDGRAKAIAKEISEGLRAQFKNQGWLN